MNKSSASEVFFFCILKVFCTTSATESGLVGFLGRTTFGFGGNVTSPISISDDSFDGYKGSLTIVIKSLAI